MTQVFYRVEPTSNYRGVEPALWPVFCDFRITMGTMEDNEGLSRSWVVPVGYYRKDPQGPEYIGSSPYDYCGWVERRDHISRKVHELIEDLKEENEDGSFDLDGWGRELILRLRKYGIVIKTSEVEQ